MVFSPQHPLFIRTHRLAGPCLGMLVALALSVWPTRNADPAEAQPPATLDATGLYSNAAAFEVDPSHLAFSPQYPLWTDGAAKRRWIWLPPGSAIDASDPDGWKFPVGTRFWKEFSFNGQRLETRYMELQQDSRWLYAAYGWTADGHAAHLVSEKGRRNAYAFGGGRFHSIPSVNDCKACHQGGRTEILGFGSLQLSPEQDPGALHREIQSGPRLDLQQLVSKGLLVGLPKSLTEAPPRILASSAIERAALGYMHGNCGHCHNEHGSLKNLGLSLRYVFGTAVQPAVTSTIGRPIKKRAPRQSAEAVLRIEPHQPDRSGLMERVASRYSALQMPPLGTELVDQEAVALLRKWISEVDDRLPAHERKDQ